MINNKALKNEIRSYLTNMFTLGIACFHVSYIEKDIEYREQDLTNYVKERKEFYSGNIENLEFCFIFVINENKKLKVNIILGVKPIITTESIKKLMSANLYSLMFFYPNINISSLEISDVKENNNFKFILSKKVIFNLFSFNINNQELFASLIDYLSSCELYERYQIESNDYSNVTGNFEPIFNEYSLFKLFRYYLLITEKKTKYRKY